MIWHWDSFELTKKKNQKNKKTKKNNRLLLCNTEGLYLRVLSDKKKQKKNKRNNRQTINAL